MASWKDGEGQYTWGKFNATGDYQDIYMVGGMSEGGTSDYFYIPAEYLDEARKRNYGTGIHFWREGNKVNITINLLIIAANSSQRFITNGYYIGNSSVDYPFYANIQYKKKSTGQWVKLGDNLITTNYGGMPLFKKDGWDTQSSGYLWKTFTYDLDLSDIEEFSIGVHGEGTDVYKWNYYKIEKIFKPTTKRLTIRYKDRSTGNEIQPPEIVNVLENQEYVDTAPTIKGYIAENPNIRVRVTNDMEYTVWYNPKPTGTLIVNYINQENNQPMRNPKIVEGLEVGTTVTEDAPTFPDYTVSTPRQSVTIRAGNNTITFLYNKVKKFIRPWAIRKSGTWRSLHTLNSRFKVRRSGTWRTMPDEDIDSTNVGKANFSPSRIRKSGIWKAQGKIGN